MNYHYTFIKVDQSITVSGSGNDPAVVMDIEWTSSPGAAAVLEQMNLIDSVYTPTIGFVSIDNYKNNMYVQIAKFGSIYKEGWRFENSNIPSPELDMVKSEILEKGKTKQRVYVKGSGKRKSYWRVQEVGREEIDPKKIENIWDIPLDQFVRLVSGDKQLLKERYIDEHRYKSYESHPTLEYLRGLMSERIRYNINPSLSYFDESIMDIGGISRHEQAVDMALSADEEVPLHVLKDYPELATLYEIDISDSALIATTPVTDYTKLYEMPKDEYDRILDSVKIAYDTDPKHITDKMLNQDYEEELADCKRSAKLRKKLFNNLPEHMQYGYTPDTMDVKLHKSLVFLAKNNNIEIPTETKAGYPTIYTDQPFTYESTGNAECDTAANDILTHIRDSLGPDDFDTDTKISEVIYNIIGATGESVPMMYGVGIETESDMEIAESVTAEVSAALISPDLMARIKGFKLDVGRSRVMLSKEDDIRSYQLNGVIHLGEYDSKTLAHEYGHAIDWMLPEINELSQAFLNNRTEGDPLIPLSEIIPWGRYTEDEMTRPDNFMDSYIGKHYDHSSSEVLSMGMGYMMSSKSMMDMYEQDPEYLGYIVAVLSGRAQGAKVTKGPWSGSDEPGGFAPTNKGEIVEIDLSKLLNTSGLTRKRVLVRRKGEAPFWSTRWVQQGDTVKETVEAAGFELVAVEGEESEKVDIRILVNEAIAAGEAAFEAGITMRDTTDPVRDEIIKRSDGSVKQELDIRDAWNTGWHTANAATLIPGLADDSAAAEARDKAEMDISWDIINPSYEAGKAAFKRGIKSSGGDFRLISILGAGNGTEATLTMVKKAWQRGWDEEAKKVPEPEPTPRVTLKSLMEKALNAGKEAFVAGSPHNEIMNDPKMVEILGQSSNLMHQLKLRENWLKGWAQAKETASANNFDTMPDVEIESDVETTSIPIADRVSGSKIIGGWSGTRPAVKVSDLQVGDIQLFTNGVALKIKEIRRSGKSYILTYEDYVNEETGKDWETKRQGRGMVGVQVPSVNVPDDFSTTPRPDPRPEPETKQLTAEDVMQPAYDAGGDAFKRGIDIKGGADDSDMINILLSIRHLPNYKQLEVMRRWMDGWQDAQKVAAPDTKPTPEYEFVGTPLADRIDKKSKMRVPGIGTTPAITVGNVQIGDRLQFPEGVFRIKGVIVKGKSSTMIFEETDDKGNNLELKKQNRSWMAVEKTQLHPLGYIPSPNKPGVPHWARTKEVEPELKRKVTTFSSEGFTPVKTVAEGMERLQRDFIKSEAGTKYGRDYGLNLNGLKVGGINSIIKGFDKVLGKYGIKLDYIGWNKRKQSGLAYYSSSMVDDYSGILFQKTATKGIKSREDRIGKNFMLNKEVNIANCERHLTYPELRPGDHDRERDKIELLKACDRWTVDASFDDMLAATAAHEASHAVYDVYKLKDAWARNLTYLVGKKRNRELKCASVSEYGMSSMSELFAEVGSAVAFDIPIDPDVKQAYLDTIGSIKQ
jgi:ribosome modulation factor